MLNALFHHFMPASLYGGKTAFPALSRIDGELRQSDCTDAVISILDRFKPELHSMMQGSFSAPVAQALTITILNILLAQHHLRARSTNVLSRPIGIIVDPSNMCQLACPGCVHSTRSEDCGCLTGAKELCRKTAYQGCYGSTVPMPSECISVIMENRCSTPTRPNSSV